MLIGFPAVAQFLREKTASRYPNRPAITTAKVRQWYHRATFNNNGEAFPGERGWQAGQRAFAESEVLGWYTPGPARGRPFKDWNN